VLIAGSYTPVALLVLQAVVRVTILSVVWRRRRRHHAQARADRRFSVLTAALYMAMVGRRSSRSLSW
jgi:predicted membrane channel-forming protein YqfA (hemolysin III family)